jgi:hypothetical protein
MDWFLWAWSESIARDATAAESSARPTDNELAVIEVLYRVLAAESRCSRCGAALREPLAAWPEADTADGSWALVIFTNCRSWRRHRQAARVTEESGDLKFGAFVR